MNIRHFLFVCYAAATLANMTERLGSVYSSASEEIHSHLKCIDSCYKKLRAVALNTFTQVVSSVQDKIRPKRQRKALTFEEFKRSIDKISEEARKNVEKEKELEFKKEEVL